MFKQPQSKNEKRFFVYDRRVDARMMGVSSLLLSAHVCDSNLRLPIVLFWNSVVVVELEGVGSNLNVFFLSWFQRGRLTVGITDAEGAFVLWDGVGAVGG